MYIIAAILIFGVLIAVHELGHFLAAKACGVRVNEFSIGMGPAIFHTTCLLYTSRFDPGGHRAALCAAREAQPADAVRPLSLIHI